MSQMKKPRRAAKTEPIEENGEKSRQSWGHGGQEEEPEGISKKKPKKGHKTHFKKKEELRGGER